MSNRIIVEGPDGGGKSTLIQELIKTFPDELHLVEGFNHSNYTEYYGWLMDQLYPEVDTVTVPVHNRFFYSELVYGKVLRNGEVRIPSAMIQGLRSQLREEAFLIYCTLPYEELLRSAMREEQMEGVVENLRKLHKEYDELMGQELPRYWGSGRCVSYNYHRPGDLAEAIDLVGMYLS